MTYNDTYFRMFLLSEARRLALRGKALAEILAARAAYIPAIDEFEKKRASITADTEADQDARDKAVADAAAEQSPAPDRRISLEAFEQIADAALAAGTPIPPLRRDPPARHLARNPLRKPRRTPITKQRLKHRAAAIL